MPSPERLAPEGTKRLLALDGGGIRGVITLGFLARIETLLRDALGAGDDFVLADYFDYVAGTSTGAIIGACISMGMSVAEIESFYRESGEAMFAKAALWRRFWATYRHEQLAETLQAVIRDRLGGDEPTLGDEGLRTLLMMVMRNDETDSHWPVSNNPYAKYNERSRDDCNLNVPLWKLIRASTAAPTFFPAESVRLGSRTYTFVDGGVTMYNNPSFKLILMATLDEYGLGWPTGEDRMLLVSVGTGAQPKLDSKAARKSILGHAKSLPDIFMYAAMNEQDELCRVLGRCRHGARLDREIGDLKGSPSLWSEGDRKLFTYMRYNAELTREGLDEVGLTDVDPSHVQQLDSTDFIDELGRVGAANAERQVASEHFRGFV